LQISIRNTYSDVVVKEPLDKLPDDVRVSSEFALETYIGD